MTSAKNEYYPIVLVTRRTGEVHERAKPKFPRYLRNFGSDEFDVIWTIYRKFGGKEFYISDLGDYRLCKFLSSTNIGILFKQWCYFRVLSRRMTYREDYQKNIYLYKLSQETLSALEWIEREGIVHGKTDFL